LGKWGDGSVLKIILARNLKIENILATNIPLFRLYNLVIDVM